MVHLTDTVSSANAPVQVGNIVLRCAVPPAAETLAAAFAAGCPTPFATLADRFNAQDLVTAIRPWKLDVAPDHFELPVHTSVFTSTTFSTTQAIRDVVLGQGELTVSPLQMATIAGVIANGGRPITAPHLNLGAPSPLPVAPLLSTEIANAIRTSLSSSSGQSDLGGQVAMAQSGESGLAWFIGFAPSTAPRRVIVVLLENGDAATSYQIADQIAMRLIR
jgi:peptidoglycan glycosyltransferase